MNWLDWVFWSEGLAISVVAGLAAAIWGVWQCVEWILAYLGMSKRLIETYRRMLQERKVGRIA